MPTDPEDLRIANAALTRLGIGRITDFVTDTKEVAVILNDQYDEWVDELVEDSDWSFARARVELADYSFVGAWIDTGTDLITIPNSVKHPFYNGMGPFQVIETEGSTLPTGLAEETNYYIEDSADSIYGFTTNSLGSLVNITAIGTGVHSIRKVPNHEWDYGLILPENCLRIVQVGNSTDENDWSVEDRILYQNIGSTVDVVYIKRVLMPTLSAPLFKRALSLKIALDLSEVGVKTTSVTEEIEKNYLVALQRAKNRYAQEASPEAQPQGTWATEMGSES